MYKNKKYTYEMVKQYFENNNCILLTKKEDYKNVTTILNFICKCKEINKSSFSNFKRTNQCKKCNNKYRPTQKDIEKICKENGYKLLDNYSKENVPLKVECPNCKKTTYKTIHQINKKVLCKNCGKQKEKESIKNNIISNLKQRYENGNFTLIDFNYKNAKHKLLCRCNECLSLCLKNLNDVEKYGCPNCANKQRRIKNSGSNSANWIEDRDYANKIKYTSKRIRDILKQCLKATGKKKNLKTEDVLGYSRKELLEHLESFDNFKNLYNKNDLHIDHIIPIKAFIKNGILDPKIINHLSNLQPLSSKENLSKSDKYLQEDYDQYIEQFSNKRDK